MKKSTIVLAALATVALLASPVYAKSNKKAKKSKGPVVAVENAVPAGEVELVDNFEEGEFWGAVGDAWDQWGSHNLSLFSEVSTEWASEGTYSGKWEFDVASADTSKQASFTYYALENPDLSGMKYMVIDVYNPAKTSIYMKANYQNKVDWNWSSTEPVEILPGVNKNVAFLFTELVSPEETACIIMDVVDENEGGIIYVDNVRIVRE